MIGGSKPLRLIQSGIGMRDSLLDTIAHFQDGAGATGLQAQKQKCKSTCTKPTHKNLQIIS